MKSRILFLIMLLCAAIASVQRVHGLGATITVTNTNDSGAGSLRWALASADDFDFINFSVTGTITLTSGQLFVGKPVIISGPGANNLTVDANHASRVFYVDAPFGSVVIGGLAITNGNADFGGGMYVAAGLFVSDCTFTGNSASQFGGGIYIGSEAFLSLQDSTVAANSISAGGEGGGGIYNDHATLQVGYSTITSNSAFRGGGVYNDHATLQVFHSTIINNDGNGIYNDGALPGNATLTIYNSTIANNHTFGNNGGGIYNDHASLEVVYSTIANNFSFEGSGGGIYNDGSYPGNATLSISNSTLSGNSVSGSGDFHHDAGNGGAIFNYGGAFGNAPVTITNSTLSGNSAIEQDEEPSGGNGGGIYNYAAPVTITKSTLSGNAAYRRNPTDFQFENGNGSGIYNWAGTLMIGDTLLDAGSSFTNPPGANIFNDRGTVTSLGYNLSSDAADGDSTAGPGGLLNHTGDVRNTDPVLGALQDNGGPSFTHALLPSSPAIDAGTDLTALNGAIDDMTTGVTATDATSIFAGVGFAIQIDSEQMIVEAKSANTLTVTRGANSTTPAAHSNGAAVNPAFDQRDSGFARKVGSAVDIGAFEVQTSTSPTPTPTATSTPAASPTATATFTPTPTPTPSPTPEATNLTVAAATGIYGGTVTLSVTLISNSSPVSGKMITFTLNGNPAGTGVTDGTGVATVTNVSLSGTNAGTYPSGVAASFAGDGSYSGSNGAAALMITPRGLTVTATGFDKVYDGTTAAMVTLSDDRIAGDSLAVAYTAASFADKDAGTGKPVSVVGISIGGDDAGNYNHNTTANTTANITLRSLLITAQNQSKIYGATFTFAGTEFDVSVGGLATGDSVTSVTLSSAGAAATAPALVTYPITPSAAVGSGLSNYAIGYADGSFTVSRSPTSTVYTGFTSGEYSSVVSASALVFSETVPPVGTSVRFSLRSGGGLELQGCTGTIDASGLASCQLELLQPSGTYSLVATALGNDNFDPSSITTTINIFVPDTNLAVIAATGTYGGMVTLSATLTSDSFPISGKTITFTLNGNPAGTGVTDGAGVATVTNVSLSGINAGTYPLGVAASFAGDAFYTATTGTAALTVNPAYAAQIQQPIDADGTSVFNVKRGVIPVKFTLTLNGVATCNLPSARIAVTRTAGGTIGPVGESVYSGPADNGSNFRIDSCQYIYNLSASALGVGTYRVDIIINTQVVGSASFGLR